MTGDDSALLSAARELLNLECAGFPRECPAGDPLHNNLRAAIFSAGGCRTCDLIRKSGLELGWSEDDQTIRHPRKLHEELAAQARELEEVRALNVERLAEAFHDAWMRWARTLMEKETLSADRIQRWTKFMVPYSQLDETAKEQDRVQARRALRSGTPT